MPGSLSNKIHRLVRLTAGAARAFGKPKVFGIGRNKTGTKSLAKALSELGITVGERYYAERLIHDWARRDFRRLFLYCHSAQAFQDVPFGCPFTFQALDQHFPGSKFILTVRDDPERWYRSEMIYYTTFFGNGETVTLDDFRRSHYVYPGWLYEAFRLASNTPEHDPFNKDLLIASYVKHNENVLEYFRHRTQDLLVLNASQPDAYARLCEFLNKPYTGSEFPWENKDVDLKSGK
jgi:hypothetical protein